ncbi:hypothetical protein D6827_02825 [Candidatus Parcubacteria bacterium]|nr:MAG: hypothetical protein D6827_02825 [Candidatus Parcubacteria bacterium]
MRDFQKDLEKLGLSATESLIYLACLHAGIISASELASRVAINRTTVYYALEKLRKKGLLSIVIQKNERKYKAEPPDKIGILLRLQKEHLNEKIKLADDLAAGLNAFCARSDARPEIRYYRGFNGLRAIQKEYELLPADMIQIVGIDAWFALLKVQRVNEQHLRISAGSKKIRSIIISKNAKKIQQIPKPENCEVVVLPEDKAPMQGEITVCGDRLALFSFAEELVAIDIKFAPIASTAYYLLDNFWRKVIK